MQTYREGGEKHLIISCPITSELSVWHTVYSPTALPLMDDGRWYRAHFSILPCCLCSECSVTNSINLQSQKNSMEFFIKTMTGSMNHLTWAGQHAVQICHLFAWTLNMLSYDIILNWKLSLSTIFKLILQSGVLFIGRMIIFTTPTVLSQSGKS